MFMLPDLSISVISLYSQVMLKPVACNCKPSKEEWLCWRWCASLRQQGFIFSIVTDH